jgi:hypothetical protein
MVAGERPVLLGMGSAGAEIVGHEAGPWSAPEQAAMSRHDRLNSATDLYMAAATAWCFATGDTPPALRERLAAPDAWDPTKALAELPEAADDPPGTRARLAAALAAALALLPSERPQRVADLRRLLHPGPASARTGPAGAVPLWVGSMPDRDEQWEVFEKEIVRGGRKPAPPAAVAGAAAPVTELQPGPPRVPKDDEGESVEEAHAPHGDGAAARARWWIAAPLLLLVAAAAVALWWLAVRGTQTTPRLTVASGAVVQGAVAASAALPAAALPPASSAPTVTPVAAAAGEAKPAVTQPVAAAASVVPSAASPPSVPLAAVARSAATRPARPAPPPSPRAACGNRSQFAMLYCMQDQCSKPALRNHPQCNELRRSGDIQ